MKKIVGIFLLLMIFACSPKIKSNFTNTDYDELTDKTEIIVLRTLESLPQDSEPIGDIKIGDSGFFTDCIYATVMKNTKELARKSGANIIKLTETREPDLASTWYRIKAKLFRNLDAENLAALRNCRI